MLPEQDESRKVESLLSKRAALGQKRGDLERKIRELGSLPADAFDKFRDTTLKDLLRLLQKAQNQLKKYGCAPSLFCLFCPLPPPSKTACLNTARE